MVKLRPMIDKQKVIEIRGDRSFTPAYHDICAGMFPAPVKVGAKSKWFLDEVLEWQQNLKRRSYKKLANTDTERLAGLNKPRKRRLVPGKLANKGDG